MTGQLPASIELDKLRRELMYRNKLSDQQNLQINQQRETLCQKQEEVNEIDRRISELQERLHRKRLLNQQLANQITVANNKQNNTSINQHNLRSSLLSANQHQQQKYHEHQKALLSNSVKGFNKQPLHRPLDGYPIIPNNTNCVDTSTDSEKSLKNYSPPSPQGPMPVNAYLITSAQNQKALSSSPDELSSQLQKSTQEPQQPELRFGASQDDFHMKLQHQKQTARFSSHNNNMNCINNNNNNNLPSSINNNVSMKNNTVQAAIMSMSAACNEEKDEFLLEFSGNKSDPKYQTLPYKFSPNSLQTSTSILPSPVSSKSLKTDSGSSSDENNKGNTNTGSARGILPTQNSGAKVPSVDLLSQHHVPFNKINTTIPSSIANVQSRVYGVSSMAQRGQPVGGAVSSSSSSMSNSSSPTVTSVSNTNSTTTNHQVGIVAPCGPELTTTANWAARAALGSVSSTIVTAAPTNFNQVPALSTPSSTNKASSNPVLTPVLATSAILAPTKLDSLCQLTRLPVESGSVVLPPTPLTLANQQKPVSSIAPTSVQHQKPSPIYQTSSTKIHPIQPQVLSSTPQGVLKERKGDISPPQSTSTPLSTPDVTSDRGTIGKPALPPKPAVPIKPTPPPRQTQHVPPYMESSPGWLTDPRSTNPSWGSENRPTVEVTSDVENNPLRAGVSISIRGITTQHSLSQTQPECLSQNSSNYHQNIQQKDPSLQDALQEALQDVDESNSSTLSPPPPPPTTEPPEEVTSFTWRANNENQSLKNKPLGSSKQQLTSESSKHHNAGVGNLNTLSMLNNNITTNIGGNLNSSNHNNNSMHMVSLSRRIEMPPAFLFPENETPPADLISTRDDNRATNNIHENSGSHDETDRIMPLGATDCNLPDENNKQTHSHDDTNKCVSNVNDIIETMNNLNTTGPQLDDNQPVINETKGESSPLHIVRRAKKGNLKSGKMSVTGSGSRRVSFDPLALLLDASLEGELELVRKTAGQVSNPSAANDEGITALHNAICAGHLDIVKFLVEFGCDVNAQDSDGWTPLHCAASCNNLAMVRFLVEHGACIFATTLSDHETAAEKCEEDEEGFDGCSEYLYSVQEKLGILNNGVVYAVFDYEAHNSDELAFHEGDKMVVLRKGDEWEREWWWSRLNDQEGYIPRNLLGLYPRVHPKKNSE
ncbi:apoptosis-stimulating of p53 protein 1 [Frankliniella occidentalis]|uniref:Apoptosis-stimulating of p53 protein 1 n=1 Tax=Frankliniella occidentalis TaxID=133901 RepID=A0A9C6U3D3_FRAOC|nr:apoptosis-stimulating of p53 protein 1 [Frankliniella occidentalis]